MWNPDTVDLKAFMREMYPPTVFDAPPPGSVVLTFCRVCYDEHRDLTRPCPHFPRELPDSD